MADTLHNPLEMKYDPDQPRDEQGRFAGGSVTSHTTRATVPKANAQGHGVYDTYEEAMSMARFSASKDKESSWHVHPSFTTPGKYGLTEVKPGKETRADRAIRRSYEKTPASVAASVARRVRNDHY